MCSRHYQRWRKRGDPLSTKHAPPGTGCINTNGYRRTGRRYDHRRVMDAALGRRLLQTEIVHHRDGNKLNNAIDNLEVMSPSEHARLHTRGTGVGRQSRHR